MKNRQRLDKLEGTGTYLGQAIYSEIVANGESLADMLARRANGTERPAMAVNKVVDNNTLPHLGPDAIKAIDRLYTAITQ